MFQSWWWMQHLPLLIFMFAFGGCVGSFINVVIYRLPAGMSLINPPSRCPVCGARLRFFLENLPILGWLFLRGKCRFCKCPISPQYMIIELLMACLFAGLYIGLYMVPPQTPFFGAIGGEWWYSAYSVAFFRTWPAFIMLSFLLAGLIAMTVIDARTFTIPIQIPLFVTVVAFVGWPIQVLLPRVPGSPHLWPIPGTDWTWSLIAFGGMAGVLIATALLRAGFLRYSFADYHEYVDADQVLGDYPHGRREMLVELGFLTPCMLGMVIGGLLGSLAPESAPPELLQALGGSMLGYLVGGGLIWGIRILGTLGFGREAMGLGDVHLMGATGAVLGWIDPIWIFFLAPFSGLLWALASTGLATMLKTARRELPYGPHLAIATLIVIVGREWILHLQTALAPMLPAPGLLP